MEKSKEKLDDTTVLEDVDGDTVTATTEGTGADGVTLDSDSSSVYILHRADMDEEESVISECKSNNNKIVLTLYSLTKGESMLGLEQSLGQLN